MFFYRSGGIENITGVGIFAQLLYYLEKVMESIVEKYVRTMETGGMKYEFNNNL